VGGWNDRLEVTALSAWRRICCPVDFSAASRAAMRRAAALAEEHRSHLTVLCVFGAASAPSPVFAPPSAARSARKKRERFASWLREAEELAPGHVASAWLSGSPADQIVGFAQQCGIDLIVMGSAPRPLLSRLVRGSVADKVARRAHCPVLVVPDVPRAPVH